jgi:hypothetical protein
MKAFSLKCFSTFSSPALTALGLASFASDQVHVPGDFNSPQEAVDASSAGSTIIVAGGTWGPPMIDKPLAMIGEPRAIFEAGIGGNGYSRGTDPAILLFGSGSRKVTLVNLTASQNYERLSSYQPSSISAGIAGVNFDSVHL